MVSATKTCLDTKRFISSTSLTSFTDQYYHVYNIRLKQARPALIRRAEYRWGKDIRNVDLEQINVSLGSEEVYVIGTIFKSMPKQPSILRELEENEPTPADPSENFTTDEDILILHETDENVQVVGDINPHEHVTGIPVALRGHQLNGGAKFEVVDICYSGPELSVYKMPPTNGSSHEDETKNFDKILIISGLEFGIQDSFTKAQREQYLDALKNFKNLVNSDKSIKRIIIAGNSAIPAEPKNRSKVFHFFDKYLEQIAQSVEYIDVMPGRNDPTSFLLPQQPFHPKILPNSGKLDCVIPNTNPCLIQSDDLIIVGTSGENVDTIRQHSRFEDSTTILKNTLEWGHIAPCAPDNLSCIPFKQNDPFLIDYVPDIYFAGNQPEFVVTTYSSETKSKIQLISVPKFSKSLSCVQINLSNIDVEEINLSPIMDSSQS